LYVSIIKSPCSTVLDDADKKRLEDLTEKVLGPKSFCTPELPTLLEDKTHRGGTAFECSKCASPVKNGSRCYMNAYSFQAPANIASPTANSKYLGYIDENLALRRTINLVGPLLLGTTLTH
jgi:hypothetical protein